jgi:hypothetical protein
VIAQAREEKQNGQIYIRADVNDATSPVVGVEWRIASASKETKKETSPAAKPAETPNIDPTSNPATKQAGDKVDKTDNTDNTDTAAEDDDSADTTDTDTPASTTPDVDGWHAFSALDGLFDSQQESAIGILQFTQQQIDAQKGKPFQIELRAHDAAGNIVTMTIEVPV